MKLATRNLLGTEWPELRSRFFDFDFDRAGWLRVEEFRDNGSLVVRAELPGMDPDKDVEVTLEDDVLHISGHREQKEEHRDSKGYRSEFRYGSFERDIAMPTGATYKDVSATYKDGILEVRVNVPKAAQGTTEPEKKIPVRRG